MEDKTTAKLELPLSFKILVGVTILNAIGLLAVLIKVYG